MFDNSVLVIFKQRRIKPQCSPCRFYESSTKAFIASVCKGTLGILISALVGSGKKTNERGQVSA
jgi:hypothetical protein